MNAFAKFAHGIFQRATFSTPLPDPEQINFKPRPIVGFFDGLSPEQKAKALLYRGREDHGDNASKIKA